MPPPSPKEVWEGWVTETSWGSQASHPMWHFHWLKKSRSKIAEVCVGRTWQVHHYWQIEEHTCECRITEEPAWPSEASKPGAWRLREKEVDYGQWRARASLFWITGHSVQLSGILCAGWCHVGHLKSAMVRVVEFAVRNCQALQIRASSHRKFRAGWEFWCNMKTVVSGSWWRDGIYLFEWMNDLSFPPTPCQNIDLGVLRRVNWRGRKCYLEGY